MNKVLVVYASRYGSTAEVAQAIAQELCSRGEVTEVHSVEEQIDPAAFDAVIVGSAIRMGRWLPAATKFVQQNQAVLRNKPTAIFTLHMLATDDSAASRQQRDAYTATERGLIQPELEAFFTGKIDRAQLSLIEKMMFKATGSPGGDRRNWQAIRTWADEVAAQQTGGTL
jgi:menaquinone-dependent protoporphyrinogen oxidase